VVEKSRINRIDDRERIIGIAHKQVVVLDAERPVWCKAVLKTSTDGAAPAGRADRSQFNVVNRSEDAKAVARHRRAALYVEPRSVPRVRDLAGEEADTIGRGSRGEERLVKADALVAEIRPIALGFQ